MNNFSEKTYKILNEVGWYQNRKIDVSSTVLFLESKGFRVGSVVKEALEQFGGLEYKFSDGEDFENFIIIPEEQIGDGVQKIHFKRYDTLMGEYLIVIGSVFRNNAIMFMSESGKVYGAYDDYYIWEFGSDIYEAINNLCECKKFKLIHEQ